MPSTLRRVLVTGAAVALLIALVGATYQGVSTAIERRMFPYPGRLVDVGGHQLHVYCTGSGAPTVVLEAPATAMSSIWAWVQDETARVTRVCSYDRAGLGWSETGELAYAPESVPAQLHELLTRAGEHEPYVLAGAELGATFASLYAAHYPDSVAALVLVDLPGPYRSRLPPTERFFAASPWLARIGLLRVTRTLTRSGEALPERAAGALKAFLNRPDHLTRAGRELATWDTTVNLADATPPRRTLPVIQVDVDGSDRIALLADRRNAEDVARAIGRAVMRVRSDR